jgi:hypothetical protein
LRHYLNVSALALAALAGACGSSSALPALDGGYDFPPGDPDGGSVSGTITTDLHGFAMGRFFVGAFEPGSGTLVAADGGNMATFPYTYRLDFIPPGQRQIRALLDLPPYAMQPFVDPAGPEDATGVYVNPMSIVPVTIRPGLLTSDINFFVTQTR